MGLHPVVHERRLHLPHRRAVDVIMRFPPVIRRVGVAQPGIGDTHTIREALPAIDYQQLAVRPLAHVRQVPRMQVIGMPSSFGHLSLFHGILVAAQILERFHG